LGERKINTKEKPISSQGGVLKKPLMMQKKELKQIREKASQGGALQGKEMKGQKLERD